MKAKDGNRKDRVQFAVAQPDVKVRHAYSMEDKRNSWYSRKDYKGMAAERRLSVQVLRKASIDGNMLQVDPDQHSLLGLEQAQSKEHFQYFKARRMSIVQAVLAEQKYQRVVVSSTRQSNPEASLRSISRAFSKVSLDIALDRATQVANEIKDDVKVVSPTPEQQEQEEERRFLLSTKPKAQEREICVKYPPSYTPTASSRDRKRPRLIVSAQA